MVAGTSDRSRILLSLVLILVFRPGLSQSQSWIPLGGPDGAYVNDVIVTRSSKAICVTYPNNVYVSRDRGGTWQRMPDPNSIGTIVSLTERSSGEILAVTSAGIARSRDTAVTWTLVFSGQLGFQMTGISESPVDSSLYVADRTQALFRSVDGGMHWAAVWEGGPINSFSVSALGWVFLASGHDLWLSEDSCRSFSKPVYPYLPTDFTTITQVYAAGTFGLYLTFDDSRIYYLGYQQMTRIYGNSMFCLTDDGGGIYKAGGPYLVWCYPLSNLTKGIPSPYFVRSLRKIALHGNFWIASTESDGLFSTTDAGNTWNEISRGLGYRQTLALRVTGDGKLIAGVFSHGISGGIFSSTGNGTWSRIDPVNLQYYFCGIGVFPDYSLVAAGGGGASTSDQYGQLWVSSTGLDLVNSLFVSREGIAFAGNSYMGVYQSLDKGHNWTPVNTGINHAYFVGFGQSTTGRIFAAAWPSGTYLSGDFGGHWYFINDRLLAGVQAFGFAANNQTVFAATSQGLMRSTDDGWTWSTVPEIPGGESKVILAPNGDLLCTVQREGMFRSGDGGRKWDRINAGPGDTYVNDLVFDSKGRLFAATNSGVFRLDDYVSYAQHTKAAARITAFPNPSGGSVTIDFEFAEAQSGQFIIYDMLGRKLDNLKIDNTRYGQVRWNSRVTAREFLASGIYFVRFEASGGSFKSDVKKMLILR